MPRNSSATFRTGMAMTSMATAKSGAAGQGICSTPHGCGNACTRNAPEKQSPVRLRHRYARICMGDATLAQAPRRSEEEMHSNALDALRDAPEKKSRAMPWRRRTKHRKRMAEHCLGEEEPSNALEKKCRATHRIGNAQKRTAPEKLRLPRTCVGKVGYGCARTCEGKATAKNRCTAHWN